MQHTWAPCAAEHQFIDACSALFGIRVENNGRQFCGARMPCLAQHPGPKRQAHARAATQLHGCERCSRTCSRHVGAQGSCSARCRQQIPLRLRRRGRCSSHAVAHARRAHPGSDGHGCCGSQDEPVAGRLLPAGCQRAQRAQLRRQRTRMRCVKRTGTISTPQIKVSCASLRQTHIPVRPILPVPPNCTHVYVRPGPTHMVPSAWCTSTVHHALTGRQPTATVPAARGKSPACHDMHEATRTVSRQAEGSGRMHAPRAPPGAPAAAA